MDLNFNTVKEEFVKYLEESGQVLRFQNEDSEINIFDCSDEFRDYLGEKYSDVEIINFSRMLETISEMKLENGKLVSIDDNEEDNSFEIDWVNELLASEDFRGYIDLNHNGVEKEEIEDFFNLLVSDEEDAQDVSFDDIVDFLVKAKEEVEENPEKYYTIDMDDIDIDDNTPDIDTDTSTAPTVDTTPTYSGGYSGGGGGYSGGGGGSTGRKSTDTDNTPSLNYAKMDLETLEGYQAQYEQKEQEALLALGDAARGETSNVQAEHKNVEEAQEAYKEALGFAKGDDSYKNSDTIEAQIAQQVDIIVDCDSAIEFYETQVSAYTLYMNQKTQERDLIQSEINGLQSSFDKNAATLSKKQGQLASTPQYLYDEEGSITGENPAYTNLLREIRALEQKQAELDSDIKSKTNIDLKDKNDEVEYYTGLVEEYTQDRDTNIQNRADALTQKTELEAQLSEEKQQAIQETKTNFDLAQVQYEIVYDRDVKAAQKTYDDIHEELKQVNEAINAQKTKSAYKNNTLYGYETFTDERVVTTYFNDGTHIPYMLIAPEGADPNEELPVLIFLHGSGEVGKGEDIMRTATHGPYGFMKEDDAWSDTLANFNGYIICPQLGYNTYLDSEGKRQKEYWGDNYTADTAGYIRDVLDDFYATHATSKRVLMGASLGGSGTILFAQEGYLGSDYVDAAVAISGYRTDTGKSQVPIIGVMGGSGDSGCWSAMQGGFGRDIIKINEMYNYDMDQIHLVQVPGGHAAVPYQFLSMDADGDGKSDALKLLFGDLE